MKKVISISLLLFVFQWFFGQSVSVEAKLAELPGVTFQQIETAEGYQACYELYIEQAIDHNNPQRGTFTQKVYLSHRGFDRPMVMVTEGYARARNSIYELSTLIKANQLDIEHRYFGDSSPNSADYQHLNLEQVTADLHHINTLFKSLYTDKWLSTGISKGGQTTIYYRYFYPEDVDVSVPYVAPHNIEFEDKRIYAWLDTIGSDDCRKRTLSYQRSLLEKRKKYIPKVVKLARKQDIRYTYFSPEQAFEFAVLEFPFSLWQWGHGCENIPSPDASKKQQLKFLDDVSSFSFWGDGAMENYGSHYYQAATQMGYYGYETEDFEGLLKALPMNPHPHAAFVPNKMNFTYDGTLSKKVFEWLKTEGNNFIYIYGANDTWTATGVPRSDQVNSHWFILKGKHHGNARIRNMNREEQIELVGALEEWLEMEIE